MSNQSPIDRRLFLKHFGIAAVGTALISTDLRVLAESLAMKEDAPGTHNMLLFGERNIYLSHLPMFDALTSDKMDYTSEHRYQVILEASFLRGAENLQQVYIDDRRKNASVRIYTLAPENFVLSSLSAAGPASPLLTEFKASVFRGHLEKGGEVVPGLDDIKVRVNPVIHFRKFDPKESKSADQKYLLFGSAQESFLAHYITKPPDFDQVMSVKVDGHSFTDDELGKGIEVTLPKIPNQASKRVKDGQQVAALTETANAQKFKLRVDKVIYFEEGELLVPPTF